MTTPDIPDPSKDITLQQWDELIGNLGIEPNFIDSRSFLRSMFDDSPRRVIGATSVGSMLVHEVDRNGFRTTGNMATNTKAKSPIEKVNDTAIGPLFIVGDDERNLDLMIFQGSLLTDDPGGLFVEEPSLFSINEWPDNANDTCVETTIDNVPVLLSRALVLGAHAVWKRALPREKYLYYRAKFPLLKDDDFDRVSATSLINGMKLHVPKYSLVSPGVVTKVEIFEEDNSEIISL